LRLIRLLKKDLTREISGWVNKDLLTAEQARAICHEYDIDFDAAKDDSGGYQLLVYLSYLFIGLAVITLIGANWDQIPRGVRMGGLIAVTALCHTIGIIRFRTDRSSSAAGFFLLGNLMFGASIILIAQIYHLGEHMPDGVFWWALGSLPFGVLTRSSMLTLFSCLLALIWFWLEYAAGYFPVWFPLFVLAGIYVLYYSKTTYTLFLTVVVSFAMAIESLVLRGSEYRGYGWDLSIEHFVVAAALAILGYAFAEWLYRRNSSRAMDYATILSLWSLRLGLFLMFVMSFAGPWRELMRGNWLHLDSMLLIIVPLTAASLWCAWAAGRLRIVLPVVLISSAALAAVVMLGKHEHAVYLQILTNICLIVAGILLIMRGTRSDTSHYFYLGVATILITAVLRYIDLIGDFIGGAILFAVMAGVLFIAARFWRSRSQNRAIL